MAIARSLGLLPLCLPCCFSLLLSSCGGNGSSPPTQNPVPAIESISPTAVTAGSAGFTLTVTGSNFLASSTLNWNGTQQKVTFVSSSQLTTTIASAQLAATGTIQLVVSNPQPGGGQASTTFTISAPAAPAVASLSPSSVTVGGTAFTLTVIGSNFVTASVVQWNGVNQPTTYIDNAHLTAAIPASAITVSSAGTLPITVATPAPGGGSSNNMPLLVEYPLPSITSLSPNAIPIGSPKFALTVVGNNFFTGATVYLNNISRVTQFVSSTQLTVSILASDVTGPAGQVAITVENPPPSAGISSVSSLVLQNPVPIISSVTPSNVLAGNPTNVTLAGSGFVYGATVQIGNQSFPGSVLSSTSLEVQIEVPLGITTLTVTNPAPTVGASNGVALTGTAAGPGLTLTVASVDPKGNTVATDGLGGAVSSTGRYYSFGVPSGATTGLFLSLRDTCLGGPTNCAPSTVQYATTIPQQVAGVSTDGRYIASQQYDYSTNLVDICTGAPAGCVPSTTPIPAATGGRTYMTPNARYLSDNAPSHIRTPSPAYIFDTCVGAAPGCTITQISVATQDLDGFGPTLSDDGRYLPYTYEAFAYQPPLQVLLHDSCLGAPPGCSPSDTPISTLNCAGEPATPSISGDAQYVAYSCTDGLKLQATCLNALPSCNPAPLQVEPSAAALGPAPPTVSAGGRYVAYVLNAATINGQTLANNMVFVFDSCIGAGSGCTQKSVPLCLNSSGAVANSWCNLTGMTAHGQYVIFSSPATNLGQTVPQNASVGYIVKNPLF